MPKPTNGTVLTHMIFKDFPEEITTPNIENKIEDELTKLGISCTLLTTTNSKTKQQSLKKASTLPSLVSHAASPSSRITQQENSTEETTRTTLKQQYNVQRNQEGSKKASTLPSLVSHAASPSSRIAQQENSTEERIRTTLKQQYNVQRNQEGSQKASTFPSSISYATSSPGRAWEQEKPKQETSRRTSKQQVNDALEHETQLAHQSTAQGDKLDQSEQQCQTKKIKAIEKQPEKELQMNLT